jgi:hypothetical protein
VRHLIERAALPPNQARFLLLLPDGTPPLARSPNGTGFDSPARFFRSRGDLKRCGQQIRGAGWGREEEETARGGDRGGGGDGRPVRC